MSMSSAGRAENSNGCVTRPKGREIGLSGFAAQIQLYSLTGSYVMATAEHREPYESRGSRTVLGARGGEIPPRDSTVAACRPAAASHQAIAVVLDLVDPLGPDGGFEQRASGCSQAGERTRSMGPFPRQARKRDESLGHRRRRARR